MSETRDLPGAAPASSPYHDHDGRPVTFERWAVLTEDRAGRRVALDELPDGTTISTVWDGVHAADVTPDQPALIYETRAVLPGGATLERKYATRGEALAGHAGFVGMLTGPSAG